MYPSRPRLPAVMMVAGLVLTLPFMWVHQMGMPSELEGTELFRNDPDPVYVVALLRFHDFEWVEEYDRYVPGLVEEFGGRFIARSNAIVVFEGEGDPPHFVVIIEWPSEEAARGFYHSSEYQPFRESRGAGASTQLLLISRGRPSLDGIEP